MQFTEEQAADVKIWVVKKLEDISDADSDVLADYVLALVRSDAPDDEIRKASIENLEDFLKENTVKFVDEVFATFNPKPPQPHQTIPQPPFPVAPQSIPFNQPLGPAEVAPYGHGHVIAPVPPVQGGLEGNGLSFSRKRSYNDGPQIGDDQDSHYKRADRPFKVPRGRRGSRGDRVGVIDGRTLGTTSNSFPHQPGGFQGGPPAPPAFPPFDPNDPLAAMIAFQAMAFPQLPGMPPIPQIPQMGTPAQQHPPHVSSLPARIPQRCRDYDTQGFCVLGSTCPYQHGTDHLVAPARDDEYDPTNSNIVMEGQSATNGANGQNAPSLTRGHERGRGRGRPRGDRGSSITQRRSRAEYSQAGPNDDKSITTIVVEQIPEDKFDEKIVRDFFSEFGNIVEVTMKPYKHLALVKYDTWAAARRAWASPKVIFDNRFVKVYWFKPGAKAETNGAASSNPATSNRRDKRPFDQEEFEKHQAEAQKLYEEKLKKRKATEEARLALEKQKEDLLKRQQEEKDKLLQKLGAKGGSNGESNSLVQTASQGSGGATYAADGSASEQTKSLRAQLAALEAEAKSLGIDPSASEELPFSQRGRGRGLGGYRGDRGFYTPRGRGYDPPFRGSYRGRGGPRGRGGVLRLDNRPKRVAVSGVEFNTDRDEALRQFLVGIGEYESIELNPDRADSQIVSFKDRYMAEQLIYGTTDIPGVGKVEFSWVSGPSASASAPETRAGSASAPTKKDDDDAVMGNNESDLMAMRKDTGHDVDYDVAEMDDAWVIE